mmetsp:Transcript_20686/g.32382  ORF Transcript_20686/g.32382 Transcript_20686/m.32382 type:complete len:217 (+) Transcript_20686:179-829(+)
MQGKSFRQEVVAFRCGEGLKKRLEAAEKRKYKMDIMDVNPNMAYVRGLLQKRSPLAKAYDLAGNKCFDPFDLARVNFATGDKLAEGDNSGLMRMAEAEIRHCRAAMLATLGGPLAQYVAPYVKSLSGFDFNSQTFAVGVLAVFAFTELLAKAGRKLDSEITAPGDAGFDPLLIYPRQNKQNRYLMRYREVNHGRLAMIVVTIWAMQNLISGNSLLI